MDERGVGDHDCPVRLKAHRQHRIRTDADEHEERRDHLRQRVDVHGPVTLRQRGVDRRTGVVGREGLRVGAGRDGNSRRILVEVNGPADEVRLRAAALDGDVTGAEEAFTVDGLDVRPALKRRLLPGEQRVRLRLRVVCSEGVGRDVAGVVRQLRDTGRQGRIRRDAGEVGRPAARPDEEGRVLAVQHRTAVVRVRACIRREEEDVLVRSSRVSRRGRDALEEQTAGDGVHHRAEHAVQHRAGDCLHAVRPDVCVDRRLECIVVCHVVLCLSSNMEAAYLVSGSRLYVTPTPT